MVIEVHEQIAGLLGDPVCGGMCGDAEDVYPAVGVLNDREAVSLVRSTEDYSKPHVIEKKNNPRAASYASQ